MADVRRVRLWTGRPGAYVHMMKRAAGLVGVVLLSLLSCAQPRNESVTETALRRRFAQNKFHIVWTLGDRAHQGACGLVHVGSNSDRIPSNDTLFIVVGDHAYTPRDVRPDQFLAWGKQFCGPDWVAPNYITPIS